MFGDFQLSLIDDFHWKALHDFIILLPSSLAELLEKVQILSKPQKTVISNLCLNCGEIAINSQPFLNWVQSQQHLLKLF